MEHNTDENGGPKLHRVLGTWDLVLLNIAAIVTLRWLTTAAHIGVSSLTLWVLGLIGFFVPVALAVLELSSRLPGEGGLYVWSTAAFGDLHGFLAGWIYWISNLVFFPSMLLFGAGVCLYVGGDRWLRLVENPFYNGVYCLATLWFATVLNIVGLQRAKWLQNIGGIAAWTAMAFVLAGGLVAWYEFGSMTPITMAGLVPDFRSMATLASLATMSFAYAGMELGPIIGGEIKAPQNTIPRAILISGVLIAAIYMAGTAALLMALPAKHISLIGGIPQALAAVGERVGVPAFGSITAGLIALASCGGIGAWITGTARLPFVFGVDHYLPTPFAALHPQFGTPYVALLTQGVLTTIVLLAALSGSTIHEAYIVLIDMTIILTFMPLFYIFAALPMLRCRAAGSKAGMTVIPGGAVVCWLVSSIGFVTTLLAVGTSVVPPADSTNPGLFLLKTVGGCIVLIGAGIVFYFRGHGTRARVASKTTLGIHEMESVKQVVIRVHPGSR